MINIFIKDISNFNFNICYFKIEKDNVDLNYLKNLINEKYNIPLKNLLFIKEKEYLYDNIFFEKKECKPFLTLNLVIRPSVH